MLEHFWGPGTIKIGLKALNHITGGACDGAVKVMEEITSGPAYTKFRLDQAQNTVSDFWDNHKDSVSDFFTSLGDTISEGLDAASELACEAIDVVADNAGDIIEAIFS